MHFFGHLKIAALAFLLATSALGDCSVTKETVFVNGTSMSPLFKDQQKLEVLKGYYACHAVERGDVIVFQMPGRKNNLVKKVLGIPGDHFHYDGIHLKINGATLKNSEGKAYALPSKMLKLFASSYPVIPADSYLVMGDNPTGSLDASRYGFIGYSQLIGRVEISR